jgi:hypothetical protein
VAASAATAAATPAIRRPPGFIPGDYQYCNRATLLIFPSEPLCCVCCMHTNGKRRPSASASTARCSLLPAPCARVKPPNPRCCPRPMRDDSLGATHHAAFLACRCRCAP